MRYANPILEYLYQRNLLQKSEKYKFHNKNLNFIGFIVRQNGIYINKNKIEAIIDKRTLANIKELQLFSDFIN